MIAAAWRRLGIGPAAFVILGLAIIALSLSRGAGAGWLVVVAATLLAALVLGTVSGLVGIAGVRVEIEAPTDASAGDSIVLGVVVYAPVPQLRTVTLAALDRSTHAVEGSKPTRIVVRAGRRGVFGALPVEVRGGLPLGIVRPARRFDVVLPAPLAVAPVPAVASLADSIGEDPTADVRTVRSYQSGDPARLVHWRSTARRGQLMVREMESAELLRGARLAIRVTLGADLDRADLVAGEAAGLAIAALDAGLPVDLLTVDAAGQRADEVHSRRDVGRRLAAAVSGQPPSPLPRARVVEVGP